MGRKLLKTVQTITTFRNPLADPFWSADPSLKTAGMSLAVTVWPQIAIQIFGTPFWEKGRAQRVDDSTVR